MKKFWKWKNQSPTENEIGKAETSERVLELYGTITEESWFDDDVTPRMFKDELFGGEGPITIWINSPGGDCVAASQIYAMLMDYKDNVTVKIDGIAASAASVIAMAGTKVLMAPTAMMMIHNPLTAVFGNHDDMKKAIEMLDEVKESIINAYVLKTGQSRAKLSHLMDAETWMDATKALEFGFADGILTRNSVAPSPVEDEDGTQLKLDLDSETPKTEAKDTTPKTSMLFSRKMVETNLKNKLHHHLLAEAAKIKPQLATPTGRKVEDLYDRLNLLKH